MLKVPMIHQYQPTFQIAQWQVFLDHCREELATLWSTNLTTKYLIPGPIDNICQTMFWFSKNNFMQYS